MAIRPPCSLEEKAAQLAWAKRLPMEIRTETAYPLAVVRDGTVAAVVIYHEWRGCGIEMSIVADTPRWATRQTIGFLLSYPFLEYGVTRITALIERKNKRSRRLVEGLGFVLEGAMHQALPDGSALMVYGFTRRAWEASRWCVPAAERKAA